MNDDNPWPFRAACTTTSPDTDHWYAPTKLPGGKIEGGKAKRARLAIALAACDTCPVRRECADAGKDEEHGIWGGIDKGAPAPSEPKPRKPRKPHTHTPEARARIAAAARITAEHKFNDFVERITTLHRSGLTYPELLTELAMSNTILRQRLARRDRLDLYSMLTGAAA